CRDEDGTAAGGVDQIQVLGPVHVGEVEPELLDSHGARTRLIVERRPASRTSSRAPAFTRAITSTSAPVSRYLACGRVRAIDGPRRGCGAKAARFPFCGGRRRPGYPRSGPRYRAPACRRGRYSWRDDQSRAARTTASGGT